MLYWPAFEFTYRLDARRLIPYIAAIEEHKQALLTRVLPPQWREQGNGREISNETAPSAQGCAQQSESSLKQPANKYPAKAHAWVRQRFVPGSAPFSIDDILTMHGVVGEDSRIDNRASGSFRKDESVQVGRAEVGGIHVGAPASRLPSLMKQYIEFINSEDSLNCHPVTHALLAHFFLTTIHPFADGNGRMSRLVATAILYQHGYNVHGGFYALSDYFYQNDGIRYHTLLHRSWSFGAPFELTEFMAFGMEGLVIELKSINSFIRMKLNRIVYRDQLPSAAVRKRELRAARIL